MKETLFETLKQLLLDSLKTTEEPITEEAAPAPSEKSEEPRDEREILNAPNTKHTRIFSVDECEKLSLDCRSAIIRLEQIGAITPLLRETLIYKAMSSTANRIDVNELKWILMGLVVGNINLEDLVFLDFVLFSNEEHTAQ